MQLEFSRQMFEEYSNIKFHENPSSGSRTVLCGQTDEQNNWQTDTHDNVNSSISQFYKYAWKDRFLLGPR